MIARYFLKRILVKWHAPDVVVLAFCYDAVSVAPGSRGAEGLCYGRIDYGEREGLDSRVRNRVSQPCSLTMRSKSAAGGNPGAASVEARVISCRAPSRRGPRDGARTIGREQ